MDRSDPLQLAHSFGQHCPLEDSLAFAPVDQQAFPSVVEHTAVEASEGRTAASVEAFVEKFVEEFAEAFVVASAA